MAIALLLIVAILFLKYKPVYAVEFLDGKVGYIEDKAQFIEKINEYMNDNQDTKIAAIEFEAPKFEFKLVNQDQTTNEEEILNEIKNSSVVTYKTYAIQLDGEEKAKVNTMEEAEIIVKKIKTELNQDLELDLKVIPEYTTNLDTVKSVETQLASKGIEQEAEEIVEEQIIKQGATVNGITLSVKPISGTITSRFGSRSSIRSGPHTGLDIAAPKGTPIAACASGTVSFSGGNPSRSYGYYIIIDHGNGVQTLYGHCSKLYVNEGDTIQAGDIIAAVGSTGNSTGAHLHLEVKVNGSTQNPQNYLYK